MAVLVLRALCAIQILEHHALQFEMRTFRATQKQFDQRVGEWHAHEGGNDTHAINHAQQDRGQDTKEQVQTGTEAETEMRPLHEANIVFLVVDRDGQEHTTNDTVHD